MTHLFLKFRSQVADLIPAYEQHDERIRTALTPPSPDVVTHVAVMDTGAGRKSMGKILRFELEQTASGLARKVRAGVVAALRLDFVCLFLHFSFDFVFFCVLPPLEQADTEKLVTCSMSGVRKMTGQDKLALVLAELHKTLRVTM